MASSPKCPDVSTATDAKYVAANPQVLCSAQFVTVTASLAQRQHANWQTYSGSCHPMQTVHTVQPCSHGTQVAPQGFLSSEHWILEGSR